MRYFIGVDLGGTNVRSLLVDEKGNILAEVKDVTESEKGPDFVTEKIINQIKSIDYTSIGGFEKVEGIGIGVPGPVDTENKWMVMATNLVGFARYPICTKIEEALNKPTFIDNDANVAGLAEALVGSGRLKKSVFYITISTGIVTINLVPLPFCELTLILPSSNCTISRVIDSPSPTPSLPCAPGRRVKALNIRCCSSSVIPHPVSATLIINRLPLSTEVTVIEPWSVYFIALLTKLFTTCLRRETSERHIVLGDIRMSPLSSRCFAIAKGCNSATHPPTSDAGSKLDKCASALPFSS